MSVLQATALRKCFAGVCAVEDVSFSVAAGEMLAMIGPNGAGKSTCFNLVGGQLRPDAGRVTLESQDITALPPRVLARRGIGRTFQITASFGSMTVRENVQVALQAHARQHWRCWGAADRSFGPPAMTLLEQVGMADQAERAAAVLAYGDLKRLELAVALAGAPRLLLMDEPTAGMAPAERGALMALVRRLTGAHGLAVLFTEHDMDVVFGVADRVIVLNRGSVIAAGPPAAIRADARVREVYLGVTPDAGSSR